MGDAIDYVKRKLSPAKEQQVVADGAAGKEVGPARSDAGGEVLGGFRRGKRGPGSGRSEVCKAR